MTISQRSHVVDAITALQQYDALMRMCTEYRTRAYAHTCD
jgi:hypothetical protein